MAKKRSPYFDDFIKMIDYSCQAAEQLKATLQDYNPQALDHERKVMHEIEHAADKVKHDMLERLAKEFVTPIDREDIMQLANELDNVTDKIEDILIRMYMYNIKTLHPAAEQFADVILRCCQALQKAIIEFPEFAKSSVLREAIIAVNSMEEEGDEIYGKAMHDVYRSGGDPVEIISWSELFDRMEDCCDACEHTADIMQLVILKNS